MKRRLVFIPIVVVVALISLSSGCGKKAANELCGEIKTEDILQNWKAISAEVKEGRICAGPHLADLLVIDYKGRKEGELVQSQTLVDRWTTLMEKKLGFVKKVPWQGKGMFQKAVYIKKGDEKKHYQISIVPDSNQAHSVKVYSVRLHIEDMAQETKPAQTKDHKKDCAGAADNLVKLVISRDYRAEFEEKCKKDWSTDVAVCVKEAKDGEALRNCKYDTP